MSRINALTNTDRGIAGIILTISGIWLTKLGGEGVRTIVNELLIADTSSGQVFTHLIHPILNASFVLCSAFTITLGLYMIWFNLFDDVLREWIKSAGRQISKEDGDENTL